MARASVSVICCIRAYRVDWLSRSLNMPVGLSNSSGMIALCMPMQPSSKTPMMALLLELACELPAELFVGRRQFQAGEIANVTLIVRDDAFAEPLAQAAGEEAVGEMFAP